MLRDLRKQKGLLDRLEKDGWIERKADKADRRSLRIFITQYARDHKESIMTLFEEANQKFLNCFSQDEWVQMQDFLTRLDQFNDADPVC